MDFKLEDKTIWSFRNRGKWATHNGKYRGNWSPYVPRNLILRYTKENDWILDQFIGSGTTLVEAKILNRNAIGCDVNEHALNLTIDNLKFQSEKKPKIYVMKEDARYLSKIKTNSIDFICTHPPYANAIRYSENLIDDISLLEIENFIEELEKVIIQCCRVLKTGKLCAMMIGDIRKNGNIYPLGFYCLNLFIRHGFQIKEIIIKEQHNCRGTNFWQQEKRNFLLLAHEYIFVVKKLK